jgi:hypothetical protein
MQAPSSSPLVGRFTPDLSGALRDGRAVLVDNTGTLAGVAAPWGDVVDVVRAPVEGATALLVRPDCHVAWASADAAPDPDPLCRALTHWFSSRSPGSAAA